MQPDTGHLMDLRKMLGESFQKDELKELKKQEERLNKVIKEKWHEFEKQGYEPLPEELQPAAEKKLAGQAEATVSLTSGGKLSRWAAKKRKEKRKMAKESKRQNR